MNMRFMQNGPNIVLYIKIHFLMQSLGKSFHAAIESRKLPKFAFCWSAEKSTETRVEKMWIFAVFVPGGSVLQKSSYCLFNVPF